MLPLLVAGLIPSRAHAQPTRLAFTVGERGEFHFDTGVVRGTLRPQGKSMGLASVIHVPSGLRLDRSMGLFSHYRVFTTNNRYGTAAWDRPSTAKLRDDGAVEVTWPVATNRPFQMRAIYHWSAPDTLDLETIVHAQADLPKFESFLASYFTERFTNSMAWVSEPPGRTGPAFLAAERADGFWHMFPRDAAALALINDGRWRIEPHPVEWTIRPALARPVAMRRDPASGVTVALMAPSEDCFAIAMPYQTEGHYSVYLSLFGQDLRAGQTARARARLLVSPEFSPDRIVERHRTWKD